MLNEVWVWTERPRIGIGFFFSLDQRSRFFYLSACLDSYSLIAQWICCRIVRRFVPSFFPASRHRTAKFICLMVNQSVSGASQRNAFRSSFSNAFIALRNGGLNGSARAHGFKVLKRMRKSGFTATASFVNIESHTHTHRTHMYGGDSV